MHNPARRFFDDLITIEENEAFSVDEKVRRLRKSLEQCCKFLTREDGLSFSNLFGRLEYLCNKKQLDKRQKSRLHEFRIFANKVVRQTSTSSNDEYYRGLKVLAESYGLFFGVEIPSEVRSLYVTSEPGEEFKRNITSILRVFGPCF